MMSSSDAIFEAVSVYVQYVNEQAAHVKIDCFQLVSTWAVKFRADDNFTFDKNGTKFFKLEENTVGKGEIAHYEQFLLFPQCFSYDLYCRYLKTRACLGTVQNLLFGKGLITRLDLKINNLALYQTSPGFYVSAVQVL